MYGGGEGEKGGIQRRCRCTRGGAFVESQNLINKRKVRRRSNNVPNSLTPLRTSTASSMKSLPLHEPKQSLLHMLSGPSHSPCFLENSIVDFPMYLVPPCTAEMLGNDLQPHESPQTFEKWLCSWHTNRTPATDELLKGFITLLLSSAPRGVSPRQRCKRTARKRSG